MKFTKAILRTGKLWVRNLETGEREEREFTSEDLKRYEADFKRMKEKGLRMPSPYGHDGSTPLKDLANSKNNAGEWEDIYYEPTTDHLWGVVDVPLPEDAKRIGTTLKEVSPAISTWMDGDGEVWQDTLNHVALVVKPVQGNQDNFKPLSELETSIKKDAPAIALSIYEEIKTNITTPKGSGPTATKTDLPNPNGEIDAMAKMKEALSYLAKAGFTLGEDTTEETLADRIILVGKALDDNGVTTNPMFGKELNGVALDINNPSPVVKFAVKSAVERKQDRINALIESGRITTKYANDSLAPLCSGVVLSLDKDGNEQGKSNLDILLDALENLPENAALAASTNKGKTKKGESRVVLSIQGAQELQLPDEGDVAKALSPEEVDKLLAKQMATAGRTEFSKVS